jgi:hypothetical protein
MWPADLSLDCSGTPDLRLLAALVESGKDPDEVALGHDASQHAHAQGGPATQARDAGRRAPYELLTPALLDQVSNALRAREYNLSELCRRWNLCRGTLRRYVNSNGRQTVLGRLVSQGVLRLGSAPADRAEGPPSRTVSPDRLEAAAYAVRTGVLTRNQFALKAHIDSVVLARYLHADGRLTSAGHARLAGREPGAIVSIMDEPPRRAGTSIPAIVPMAKTTAAMRVDNGAEPPRAPATVSLALPTGPSLSALARHYGFRFHVWRVDGRSRFGSSEAPYAGSVQISPDGSCMVAACGRRYGMPAGQAGFFHAINVLRLSLIGGVLQEYHAGAPAADDTIPLSVPEGLPKALWSLAAIHAAVGAVTGYLPVDNHHLLLSSWPAMLADPADGTAVSVTAPSASGSPDR